MLSRYGHWKTIYGRYRRWKREGLFDRILERFQLQFDNEDRIDWSQLDINGSNSRVDHAAACARKKGANRRAKQPRSRVKSRGLGYEASCGNRWQGAVAGGDVDSRLVS